MFRVGVDEVEENGSEPSLRVVGLLTVVQEAAPIPLPQGGALYLYYSHARYTKSDLLRILLIIVHRSWDCIGGEHSVNVHLDCSA